MRLINLVGISAAAVLACGPSSDSTNDGDGDSSTSELSTTSPTEPDPTTSPGTATDGTEETGPATATDGTETEGEPELEGLFLCELDQPCAELVFDQTAERPEGEWSTVADCVFELIPNAIEQEQIVEINTKYCGEPTWVCVLQTVLLLGDGTVLHQRRIVDEEFDSVVYNDPEVCTLKDPQYFVDCLDAADLNCLYPNSWMTDCTAAAGAECPGS